MAKASDNPFPSLLIVEGTEPTAPASGRQRLYIDSTTHLLKRTDSSGVDVTIEGGAAAATDGWNSTSGFSYSSADSPTFVITTSADLSGTIPVGARIKLTQTTAKYFIVTAITASTITVYGGTDYTLANAAITSPYWSIMKAPFGFPLNPAKWTVETYVASPNTWQVAPVNGTWYNVGPYTIVVPIGIWLVSYQGSTYSLGNANLTDYITHTITLSTSTSSETNARFTTVNVRYGTTNAEFDDNSPLFVQDTLVLAAKTTYYLILKHGTTANAAHRMGWGSGALFIKAVCVYL